MNVETPQSVEAHKSSRIISTVLSSALRLWLRSQVESLETLQFQIEGSDRQLLQGHLPRVLISASRAVYRGLYLSKIQLQGGQIRVNLGQVFKGKPLRLLEPIPIFGQLLVVEHDLQASLQAPLFANALHDLLATLLEVNGSEHDKVFNTHSIRWQRVKLKAGKLVVRGTSINSDGKSEPVAFRAGLQLVTPQQLRLDSIKIQLKANQPPVTIDYFNVDLGSQVNLEHLSLTGGQLFCQGTLIAIPEEESG